MKKYITLMRPKHWIKNILIFVPLFFSLEISKVKIISLVLGFISFSLLASSIYIINDIFDIESDRTHPKKCKRPLASGDVQIKNAVILILLLSIVFISVNSLIYKYVFNIGLLLILLYGFINILYSKGLKNYPIIDIFILAFGFVIRIYYGSVLINTEVSSWLLLTTLSGALFLGIGKRKKEINKGKVRPVLENYTEEFLDKFLIICLSLSITFYSLWVMNQHNRFLYFSIPIVIFIIMEYMLLSDKQDDGDPITIFCSSKMIMFSSIIYIIYMYVSLYII